jgi:nucleolar protein TMA23
MDDSSANATDASMPPSGASTPLTSASETEASKKAAKKLDTKPKRKRKDDGTMAATKKAKRSGSKDSKEDKATQQDSAAPSKAQDSLSTKDRNAVTRKIAKLSSQKKALSEERAAAKKQTLEEYILRRISKKSAMRATRYAKPPPETLFFTDVKGDATLVNQRTTNTPLRPVLGIIEESLAGISLNAARTEEPESVTEKTPTKKPIKRHLPSANTKKMHYGRSVERGEQKSGTVDTRV